MEEHPIERPIRMVIVGGGDFHQVGRDGVTRIEACIKPGMYSNIPYVRVWQGEECIAEFCQHHIIGVYFGEPEPEPEHHMPAPTAYADPAHTGLPNCTCFDCIPF